MTAARVRQMRDVCKMIQDDARADAYALDGQSFNGKVVATQFGNCLASIAALAGLVDSLLDSLLETSS